MTHLDLCSGIGGFHLAAEWAGFETVGFAEVESYCCKLLAQKWPKIKNYGDLRRADFSELRGRVDVLSAGVPCQPASLAGKRRGKKDDRWLWDAVLDVVGRVQPVWCIFENPLGILSLDEFGGVLLRLESFGYQVRAFSVPANAVGAKHRRQRVFIVANASGRRCDREGERQDQQPGRTEAIRASETMADADGARSEACNTVSGGDLSQERNDHQRDRETLADAGCFPEEHDGGLRTASSTQFTQTGISGLYPGLTEPGIRLSTDGISDRLDPAQVDAAVLKMPPLTASPLVQGRKIRDRSAQLKALGNSVVPQQAYPFFEAIGKTIRGC